MIQHIGEVLAVLTAAFVLGSIAGWIAYRWIDRTDYAFDQRDLADAIGRLFGIRTPAPSDEPVVAGLTSPVPRVADRPRRAAAEPRSESLPRPEPAPRLEPAARHEPATRPGPIPLPVEVVDWLKLEPASKSEAAEDLRKRVQSSSRALAWREARDERLRPGESAAQVVAGAADVPDDGKRNDSVPAETSPVPAELAPEPPRVRKSDEAADPDEPWAAAPEVWPGDLRRPRPPDAGPAQLALPAPVQAEIRLALAPVATPPLAADDIWSDEDDASARTEDGDTRAPAPPPAEDRPPALDEAPKDRDNLRRIKGIGQGFEKRLNQLGIYRYAQIVAWTGAQQAWISAELGFPGRVERDDWPKQASRLVKGAEARAGSETEVARDP